MKALISKFSSHLKEALEIGEAANLKPVIKKINKILISGLGGSGIGGTIVSQLIDKEASISINTNKDYFIPGYVDNKTLVIISSYSGNTEETLNAFSANFFLSFIRDLNCL